jgi:hypothetical protein
VPAEVIVSVLGTLGTLLGVVIGAALTNRSQRLSWDRQEKDRSRAERRRIYADFLSSTREWRAVSLSATARIVGGSVVARVPHADGGASATRALSLRSELSFIAESPATIAQSFALVRALGNLAQARAEHPAGSVPESIVQACRDSEWRFVAAARAELGSPELSEDFEVLRRGVLPQPRAAQPAAGPG